MAGMGQHSCHSLLIVSHLMATVSSSSINQCSATESCKGVCPGLGESGSCNSCKQRAGGVLTTKIILVPRESLICGDR